MSPDLLSALVQSGVAGIFIWYLWQENKRLCAALAILRQEYREETRRLRDELARRDREQLHEQNKFSEHLWRIGKALQPIAEHAVRERRRALVNQSDDTGMGTGTSEP